MIAEADRRAADQATPARWRALASVRDDAVRVMRSRLVDAADVEDHVHEAMVRLCVRPLRDLDADGLRALLVRSALNIAIDGYRRSGRYRRLLPRLLDPGTTISPEDIIAERSEASWLAAGVSGLGALERSALAYAATGRGVDEIAEALGVEYKAAENALGRARRKLRLRAAAVVVVVGGVMRRLRCDDHAVAVTASALAAALLLLGPSSHREMVTAPAPVPRAISAVPSRVQPIVRPVAAPVTAALVSARIVGGPGSPAHRAPSPSATPAPASPPPLPMIPQPLAGCPQYRGKLNFPAGSPQSVIVGCVLAAPHGRGPQYVLS